jgi:DNA-directed RNA polymerase sigma subunit (sigma70/sigma32)
MKKDTKYFERFTNELEEERRKHPSKEQPIIPVLDDEDDEKCLKRILRYSMDSTIRDRYIELLQNESLRDEVLDKLSPRQEKIFRLYATKYWEYDEDAYPEFLTLAAVGKMFGVQAERIRQIFALTVHKLDKIILTWNDKPNNLPKFKSV